MRLRICLAATIFAVALVLAIASAGDAQNPPERTPTGTSAASVR
jgi:hypothetical protein